MTLTCRGYETESRNSTFIVVTSRIGSSFNASIIEELKCLLKALLSVFLKIAFVVRSNGCERFVMFFGTINKINNKLTFVCWKNRFLSDTIAL